MTQPDSESATPPARAVGGGLPFAARAALIAFLLFGTYTRVAGVWNQALYGDEKFAHLLLAEGYGYILTHFDAKGGSHVPLPLLQRASMDLFGPTVSSYRLPAMIAGLLGLWLFYPLGRCIVGSAPAWLATLLLAVHPMHVFYSRFARAYTLVFLLGLLLVFCLVRALEGRRRAWSGVALASALLPWAHLSTAAPVAVLDLLGIALAWRQPTRAALRGALLATAAGAVLCAALYAPTTESLIESMRWRITLRGRSGAGFTEVLALLGGSTLGGWVLALASSAASIVGWRRGKPFGAVFLAALVTPAATVWLSDTIGHDTAYARYQFLALVPLMLGSAWGFLELLGRVPRLGGGAGQTLGLALVSLQAIVSPIPLRELYGTFSNHRSWLVPEPTLALPFSRTPAIYGELANSPRPLTIVEFPLTMQSEILFDNYQRQHRQRTLVGVTKGEGVYSRRPYVSLLELDLGNTDVDCVIVHKDVRREVEIFLDEAWPERRVVDQGVVLDERATRRLRERWGEPSFEDEFVQAWMVAGR